MPRRFLPGVDPPRAYPLGLIGPGDMDLQHMPFVIRTVNFETYRLSNLVILVHGWRSRLSYNMVGGIEEVAKFYSKRYWYDLKIYRDFKHVSKWGDPVVSYDGAFFEDAKGFVVFDDGSHDVRVHKKMAQARSKPIKTYKLLEKW